jgi:hypothetical protein
MQRQPHACSRATSQAQQLCMRTNGRAQRGAAGIVRRCLPIKGRLQHVERTLRKMHLIMSWFSMCIEARGFGSSEL